jgi:hypothetical protein
LALGRFCRSFLFLLFNYCGHRLRFLLNVVSSTPVDRAEQLNSHVFWQLWQDRWLHTVGQ